MAFLKLLLTGSLIFITARAHDYERLLSLPDDVIPNDYDIKLIPMIKRGFFYGECNISITLLRTRRDICFNSENLGIVNITLIYDAQKSNTWKEVYYLTPTKYWYNNETHTTCVDFVHWAFGRPFAILPGPFILRIYFTGIIADNIGGFRIFNIKETKDYSPSVICLTATHFNQFAVRQIFPCFKWTVAQTFSIVVRHNSSYKALSNMPIKKEQLEKNYMQWTYFETTPSISPYFVAIVLTNFAVIQDESKTIQVWCREPLKAHTEFAHKVIIKLTQHLKQRWPTVVRKISKVDYIAIPNVLMLENEGMVNFGFVVFRETDVMLDMKLKSIGYELKIIRLMTPKVVYEWLDTGIYTPTSLNYWLSNKGLVMFLAANFIDEIYPDYQMMNLLIVQDQQEILRFCNKDWMPHISNSDGFVDIYHSTKSMAK